MAWLPGYTNRIPFSTAAISSALTDFPVAVSIGASVGLGGSNLSGVFSELSYPDFSVEDFSTGTGSTVDLDRWDQSNPFGYASIINEKWNVDTNGAAASDGGADLISRFRLQGQYDYQVDCSIVTLTTPSALNSYPIHMRATTEDGTLLAQVGYYKDTVGNEYCFAQGVDQSFTTFLQTDSTPQFRIAKVGTSIKVWWYDAGQSRWEWNGSTSGLIVTNSNSEDISITITCYPRTGSDVHVDIDNMVINAGTITWPPGTYPTLKKFAITTSGGTTQLPVEVDTFNAADSKGLLHFKAPSLPTNGATFYLYYDKDVENNDTYVGIPGSTIAASVWDSDHVQVLHFSNNPNSGATDAMIDSSKYGNNGTSDSTMNIDDISYSSLNNGRAINFDGVNQSINAGSASTIENIANLTIEAYINPTGWGTDSRGRIVSKNNSGITTGWEFLLNDTVPGKFGFVSRRDVQTGAWYPKTSIGFTLGSWQYLALSYNYTVVSNDPIFYYEGATTGVSAYLAQAGNQTDAGNDLIIGNGPDDSRDFNGKIGEIRISKVIRSADWINTTYKTLSDKLITFGAIESDWLTPYPKRRSFTMPNNRITSGLSDFPAALVLGASVGIGGDNLADVFTSLYFNGNDPFTGSDGDLPDPSRWYVEANDFDKLQILSNKLNFNGTAIAGTIVTADIRSTYFLKAGNFDTQIDYDITTITAPGSGANYAPRFQLLTKDITLAGEIGRTRSSTVDRYYAQGADFPFTTISDQAGDTTGKLRLTRSSGVIKGFYWSGSQWEWNNNTSGITLTNSNNEDLWIRIYWEQEAGSDVNANVDNLIVNAGSIVYPLGLHANRKKIAITLADKLTQIPAEIEFFNEDSAILHTKVSALSGATQNKLYLYYGGTSLPDNSNIHDTGATAAASIWDSDYVAVYHMSTSPEDNDLYGRDQFIDSTGSFNGVSAGTMLDTDLVDGDTGKAVRFEYSKDQDVNAGTGASINDLTNLTIEAYINPTSWGDSDAGRILAKLDSVFQSGWEVYTRKTNNHFRFTSRRTGGDTGGWETPTNGMTVNAWQHIAVSYNNAIASDPVMYISGATVSVNEYDAPVNAASPDSANPLMIAGVHPAAATQRNFDGKMQEIRLSKSIRSAAWIKAGYHSITDDLGTWGAAETYGATSAAGAFGNIAINGSWKAVSSLYIAINENWKAGTKLFISINNQWKQAV